MTTQHDEPFAELTEAEPPIENPRVDDAFMQAADAAYRRDLPELLKMRRNSRRWVMYHGEKRVGFGATTLELYQLAHRLGLDENEIAVLFISDVIPCTDLDDLPDV